jgi:hypothetical protein
MRKVFWMERILTRLHSGELRALCHEIKTRKTPAPNAPSIEDSPFTQEFVIFDPSNNQEIARCQQFLKADPKVLGGSGLPDPKQVCIGGLDYHQKGHRACEHCTEGWLTEYTKDINVWENHCNETNTRIRGRG